MTHPITNTLEQLRSALTAGLPTFSVEVSRGYEVSEWPSLNIRVGAYVGEIQNNTREGKPRVFYPTLEVYTVTDAQLVQAITVLEDFIETNTRGPNWTSIAFDAADPPEDMPGDQVYTVTVIRLQTKFEV